MLYSMTGFGKATAQVGNRKITVEVKSLNSKQIDIAARVPASVREHELAMRNAIAQRLERGKVDLIVTLENIGPGAAAVINGDVVREYQKQILAICQASNLQLYPPTNKDWWPLLLRLPDVMRTTDTNDGLSPQETQALMDCLAQALDSLVAHRRAEGEKLEHFFTLRLDTIQHLLDQVPQYETTRVTKIRERMTENLKKLPTLDIDPSRLEQELFFYIEKLDINEEKQRLAQHIAYFRETMTDTHGGQGKKLGFISQEMGREINTLGSKSNDADMQRLVVRMKDALEQIKEQVLNLN